MFQHNYRGQDTGLLEEQIENYMEERPEYYHLLDPKGPLVYTV